MSSPPDRRRGILSRILRGKDKDCRQLVRSLGTYVSSDGSISHSIWTNAGPDSELPVRIRTLDTLISLVSERRLDQGTVEALYHRVSDLLEHEQPAVRRRIVGFLTTLSHRQQSELSLALRATFFAWIRSLGPDELALAWLNALTEEGRTVCGFEEQMAGLTVDWTERVLRQPLVQSTSSSSFECVPVSPAALLSFVQSLLRNNAAFVDEIQAGRLVHSICIRTCVGTDDLITQCLDLLDTVLGYSFLPRAEMLAVVTTVCKVVNDERHAKQGWHLMRSLLRSHLGYAAMHTLCRLLEETATYPEPRVIAGAIFCIGMGLWGAQRVESLNYSPASVLPAMITAIDGTEHSRLVAYEALLSVQRLVHKYGADLQLFTWDSVLALLAATARARKRLRRFASPSLAVPILSFNSGSDDGQFARLLHDVITIIEQQYDGNQYSGSPETLFALIDNCADERPEVSIVRLLDYKAQSIYPVKCDWLDSLNALLDRYYRKDRRTSVRTKAIEIVQRIYTNYRRLYEWKLIQVVIIPLFADLYTEKDVKIQDLSLNLLFDVAKTLSTTDAVADDVDESEDILTQVLSIVDSVLNGSINKVKAMDDGECQRLTEDVDDYLSNLEIIVCGINDIIEERWLGWPSRYLLVLFDMLCEHVQLQYEHGLCHSIGSIVRERILALLLHIVADPATGRLGKRLRPDEPYVFTPYLICAETDSSSTKSLRKPPETSVFHWTNIVRAVTTAVQKERCWPVLKTILPDLATCLQCRPLVLSAPLNHLTHLLHSLLNLINCTDRFIESECGGDSVNSSELSEAVCPVLASLISYARLMDEEKMPSRLCHAIQECIVSERSVEAVLATEICVLSLSDAMTPLARDLVGRLADLPSSPRMAIPVLELLAEAASIPSFYRLFQEKHFKFIVDVLTPYTSVDQFTTFIVSASYRLLCRWYLVIPLRLRLRMARYMMGQIDSLKMSTSSAHLDAFDTVNKPAIKSLRNLHEDARATLVAFLRHFIFTNQTAQSQLQKSPFDTLPDEMLRTDHWLVGTDSIVTIRTAAFDHPRDNADSVFGDVEPNGPLLQMNSTLRNGESPRRRHQSAIQSRVSKTESIRPMTTAMDDSFLPNSTDSNPRNQPLLPIPAPSVVDGYTEVVVRHPFGLNCWFLRSQIGVGFPTDFIADLQMHESDDLSCSQSPDGKRETVEKSQKSKRNVSFETNRPQEHIRKHRSMTIGAANVTSTSSSGEQDGENEELNTVVNNRVVDPAWPFVNLCQAGSIPPDQLMHMPFSKSVQFARTLRILDCTSHVELHTVGVVYAALGEKTEMQMLANRYGSDRYERFIRHLGNVESVGGRNEPGGLTDKDGHFTYCMDEDSITRVVFHVATLMPTVEGDPACNAKKKFIGNDYVTIVYNDSGRPYELGTISGRFAYVAVVVEPQDDHCLSVTCLAKDEIRRWLATKKAVLDDERAALLSRKLALRAQMSALVWLSNESTSDPPYLGRAVERYRKIRSIRERFSVGQAPARTFLDVL